MQLQFPIDSQDIFYKILSQIQTITEKQTNEKDISNSEYNQNYGFHDFIKDPSYFKVVKYSGRKFLKKKIDNYCSQIDCQVKEFISNYTSFLPEKPTQKLPNELQSITLEISPKVSNKSRPYPTKNFLPGFKSHFLRYLSPHFRSQYFEEIEIIKRIKNKDCINMQDYQDLFRFPEFKPILQEYFKNKVIYRDLLQSRIEWKTKRNYFKRIDVFEQSFLKGEFKGINSIVNHKL